LDGRKYNIAVGQIDIGNALTEMAQRMTQGVQQANGEIAIEAVMDVSNVGTSVLHMASLPLEANVLNMTVMASKMPFVGRG
jgi:NADP-dependent 3-hydroxy acid dehydrogenase YdfG